MKIVGWIFIASAMLGILFFLSYIWGWGFYRGKDLMGPRTEGGASNAPIMLGLFALAGAYLISLSSNKGE